MIQLEKFNREIDPEKKASIIIDPIVIFKKAVSNCKPILKLTPVKRGGSYYQVCFISNFVLNLITQYYFGC